ncbi:uncharacterized protein METZ01_LOCUS183249, partial [marine metagenome]
LLADSRLIDAGHPDSTDADGTIADMGAYYYDQAGQPLRVQGVVTTPTDSRIFVNWQAAAETDLASYNIYRSLDGDEDFYSAVPHTSVTTGTQYVEAAPAEDVTYFYRVSAVDDDGDEGLLGFMEHGRISPDNTALYMPDVYLSRTTPPDLDAGTAFTLEGFFRFPVTPAEERKFIFLGWEVSVATFPDEAGTLLRLIHNENSYDGIVITDTSWHHLALATDGSTTTLWVDGYAAAQSAAGFNVNGGWLQLGNPGSSAQTIEMDEVRLSNVTRYSAGFIPAALTDDENTLGYWRFNEGSLDANFPTVYDLTGNGLHLALDGAGQAAWNPDVPARSDTENAIAINEIMPNPLGTDGGKEWFELYNRWFTPVHLQGWTILGEGANESHVLASDLEISKGGYGLLGQTTDSASNGGYVPDYAYGTTVSLSNFGETLTILNGSGAAVDSVAFGSSFPFSSGVSMELIRPDYNNNDSTSWLAAGLSYGNSGNMGTPGMRNAAFSGTIALNNTGIDYGYVTEGAEAQLSVTVYNQGVADLVLSSIVNETETFSLSPNQATIAPNDSIDIFVTFLPQTVQVYHDTITILSDDPYNPVNTVILTGSAINEFADIVVQGNGNDSLFSYQFPFTRLGY